jgi:hypothetical protein
VTPSQVLLDRAEHGERKAAAARVAADCILDRPVEPGDTWGADLRMKLYRAQLHFADAYAEYGGLNRTAYENALLAEHEQHERRVRYDNHVSVTGRTLAQDVARRESA